MEIRRKRCTVKGNLVDPDKVTTSGAPTDEKLPDGQLKDHYILCPEDRAKGFVRPVRTKYVHEKCGSVTTMPLSIAETYAAQPSYYGRTFCARCGDYYRVGANGEFVWEDGSKVGS